MTSLRHPALAAAFAAVLALAPATLPAAAAEDPVLAAVPAGSVALVSIDWGRLRGSELFRRCEERWLSGPGAPDLDEFVRTTGLDPLRDIDRVVVAWRGMAGDRPRGGVTFVTGRFSESHLIGLLEQHGAAPERVDDSRGRLYRLGQRGDGEPAPWLAFAAENLLLIGDRDSLVAALDSLAGRGESLAADGELLAAYRQSPRRGQAWGAVALDALVPPLVQALGQGQAAPLAALRSLRWASFDAAFGRDLELSVLAAAPTSDEAELVRQSADGLLALSRLAAKGDPDLLALLDETRVARDGEVVTLRTILDPEALERGRARPGEGEHRRER